MSTVAHRDHQVISNGNLPAGVTDADTGGAYRPDPPSLKRFIAQGDTDRLSARFKNEMAGEMVNELIGVHGKEDWQKLEFVNSMLATLEQIYGDIYG